MAKKFAKTLVGIGAAAVAGKVAYDKYKTVKEAFTKEENESVDAEVKKYNAIFEKKVVEVEDDWNVYMTGDVFYIAKVTLSNEFAERLRAL